MVGEGRGDQPREGEEPLKSFAETSPVLFFQLSPTGEILALSPADRTMHGSAPEQHLEQYRGRHYLDCIHPDEHSLVEKSFDLLLSGARRLEIVVQLIPGDGRRIWAEIQAAPRLDGEKIVGVQGSVRDISERKRGESAARRNNSRRSRRVRERDPELWRNVGGLRQLLDTTSAGIGILHRQRFQYGNERLARITGYTASELPGIDWRELFAEESGKDPLDPPRLLAQTGSQQGVESRWRRKDGTPVDVLFSTVPLATSADPSRADRVALTVLDVTALKQAERQRRSACDEQQKKTAAELRKARQQLMRAEQLRAIGSLAASIAHEFNNPLCGVRSVVERMARKSELAVAEKSLLELALAQCDRMKRLVRNLQQFNPPFPDARKDFELHPVIDSVLLLLKRHLKIRKAAVCKEYAAGVLRLTGVENQIKQVLLTLIKNSGEAMAEAGGEIRVLTRRDQHMVHIVVSDTGVGINPEHLPHIFEPFFTPPTAVEETGLGLAVADEIVKGHQGEIRVESIPARGTTFTVILPAGNTVDNEDI